MQQLPEIFPLILFYGWSGILIAAAVGVITARNPVHSVLLLVLCFVISAAIWLLLRAEFLAVALVLVYVGAGNGAAAVRRNDAGHQRRAHARGAHALCAPGRGGRPVAGRAALIRVWWLRQSGLEIAAPEDSLVFEEGNTQALGTLLYTEHLYAFEIAGYILLLAIVGAITLTLRRRRGLRVQKVSEQVAVRPGNRVRLVKMPAEKDE